MPHRIALSACCLLFSAAAYASISDIKASNNQVGIQTISTNVDYTETGNGTLGTATGKLDTETGNVPGSAISISAMTENNHYFEAAYDHSTGNTTYTGMPITGGVFGSIVGVSGATLTNFSARIGQGYVIDGIGSEPVPPFMLTPYVEVGRHKWDRGVNYGETYTHNYLTVGTLWQFSPVDSSNLVFSANAMVGTTFGSYIVVNSGPGVAGFSGALGNSTIYKLGLSVDYAFSEHFHGNAGVDYSSFSYGMSAIYPAGGSTVEWEPDSKTNYTTLKFGLGYAF